MYNRNFQYCKKTVQNLLYFGHLDSSDYIRTSVPAICYTPNIGNPYSCEEVNDEQINGL